MSEREELAKRLKWAMDNRLSGPELILLHRDEAKNMLAFLELQEDVRDGVLEEALFETDDTE